MAPSTAAEVARGAGAEAGAEVAAGSAAAMVMGAAGMVLGAAAARAPVPALAETVAEDAGVAATQGAMVGLQVVEVLASV